MKVYDWDQKQTKEVDFSDFCPESQDLLLTSISDSSEVSFIEQKLLFMSDQIKNEVGQADFLEFVRLHNILLEFYKKKLPSSLFENEDEEDPQESYEYWSW